MKQNAPFIITAFITQAWYQLRRNSKENVINFVKTHHNASRLVSQTKEYLPREPKETDMNGLASVPSSITRALSLCLPRRRKNLLPLPSHRLLPEASPSLGTSLIGTSQMSRVSNSGCRMEDSVANSSPPPGTSRSARMIVTAFRGEWTVAICAQCHIVISSRVCAVLGSRNLCMAGWKSF